MHHKYNPEKLVVINLKEYSTTSFNIEFLYNNGDLYKYSTMNLNGYKKTKKQFLDIVDDCNNTNKFVLLGNVAVNLNNVKELHAEKIDDKDAILYIILNNDKTLTTSLNAGFAYSLVNYFAKQKSLFLKRKQKDNETINI